MSLSWAMSRSVVPLRNIRPQGASMILSLSSLWRHATLDLRVVGVHENDFERNGIFWMYHLNSSSYKRFCASPAGNSLSTPLARAMRNSRGPGHQICPTSASKSSLGRFLFHYQQHTPVAIPRADDRQDYDTECLQKYSSRESCERLRRALSACRADIQSSPPTFDASSFPHTTSRPAATLKHS